MRLLVLGANGPSGRETVRLALQRGIEVLALTRHPEAFPIQDPRLHVIGGDATDPATMDAAIAQCDAIVSVIGTSYTRREVRVYSASARLVVEAMRRHGLRRMVAVTSANVARDRSGVPFVMRFTVVPFLRHVIGRTVYDDMTRMESILTTSDLDWTIVRPPALTDAAGTGYAATVDSSPGMFLARSDLAAFLLDQLDSDRFVRRIASVASPEVRASVLQTIRQDAFRR